MTERSDLTLLSIKKFGEHFLWHEALIWGVERPVTIVEIEAAMASRTFESTEFSSDSEDWSRERHIARCAHLAVHGWEDPIEVDVGIPALGFYVGWPIQDGNHRFLAAVARGDRTILASCAGQVSFIRRLSSRSSRRGVGTRK